MKNLTPELIAKAQAAKNAEELMALAKENNLELTQEQATVYFKQLNTNGVLHEGELELVAGGACGNDDGSSSDGSTPNNICYPTGTLVKVVNGKTCPGCGGVAGRVTMSRYNSIMSAAISGVKCVKCDKYILDRMYGPEVMTI